MKRIQTVFAATLSFMAVFLSGIHCDSLAAGKIRLIQGWEPWAPFAYSDGNLKLTGIDIEIIRHIFNGKGYVVEYLEAPWPRQLKCLEEGDIQIAASAMKTPERETYAFFSEPYYSESYYVFIRKGEKSKYSARSLKDIVNGSFLLGVMRGSIYGSEFDGLMKNPEFLKHIQPVAMDEQNYKKLLAFRLDGFIQESSRMSVKGRELGIYEKVEPLFLIEENQQHFMISKKTGSPEVVRIINDGLKEMRKDGTYQEIFRKYKLEKYNMLKNE
jgi:polar amino acid transport system substrate-binding protein